MLLPFFLHTTPLCVQPPSGRPSNARKCLHFRIELSSLSCRLSLQSIETSFLSSSSSSSSSSVHHLLLLLQLFSSSSSVVVCCSNLVSSVVRPHLLFLLLVFATYCLNNPHTCFSFAQTSQNDIQVDHSICLVFHHSLTVMNIFFRFDHHHLPIPFIS